MATHDGGRSWSLVSFFPYECWQPLAISGTHTYFFTNDYDEGLGLPTGLYRTDDAGQTLKNPVYSFDPLFGYRTILSGMVGGDLCLLVAQSAKGFLISRDEGVTWTDIGGPTLGAYPWDNRFYVKNGAIFAADSVGGLWFTQTNAHSHTSAKMAFSFDTIDLGAVYQCASNDTSFCLSNLLQCDSINVTGISLSDSSIVSLRSPKSSLTIQQLNCIPITLHLSRNQVGAFSTRLRISLIEDGESLDTFLVLKGTVAPSPRVITLAVDSIGSQVCDSANGVLTITNTSCNLMRLDSILLPLPMYLLPNQLSLGIPSGGSQQVFVRFVPTLPGNDTISFHAVLRSIYNGDTTLFDTVLKLVAMARPGNPAVTIADTTISFGTVSICSNATLPAYFMSSGCDSLRVSGEVLSAGVLSSGFSVLNAHSGSLGISKADSVLIHFAPPGVKKFYDTLWVSTNAGVRKVYVSGQGTADPGKIVLSDTSLAFGTVTASCDSSARSFRCGHSLLSWIGQCRA